MRSIQGKYLTTKEAADLLGVSRQTVWSLATSGKVPSIRVGNQWLLEDSRALRSYAPRGQRNHCGKGHEYTSENTLVSGNRRYCRTCLREKTRRLRSKGKMAKKHA